MICYKVITILGMKCMTKTKIMTILRKHTQINYSAALVEELIALKNDPNFNTELLNWETFDPTDYKNCFLGQGYNQSETVERLSRPHREKAGRINLNNLNLTVLETWSYRLWRKLPKEKQFEIKYVFDFLKGIETNPPNFDNNVMTEIIESPNN